MPLVIEADFGRALKPIVHRDRVVDFNVIIYLQKGGMEIIEDSTAYELVPGSLFFLKAGIHHWGVKPFLEGTSWYYAHFHCAAAEDGREPLSDTNPYRERSTIPLGDHRGILTLPKLLQVPPACGLQKEMERLIQLFKSAHGADLVRLNLLMWEILLHSIELANGNAADMHNGTVAEKVIHFLQQSACKPFAAEELEREVGVSYKYAGTLFKAKTGMTIKEYQLMLRMQKAVKLLCETEWPMAEIAASTGFYDAFYFSKTFRREKGLSPKKFRDAYVPKT